MKPSDRGMHSLSSRLAGEAVSSENRTSGLRCRGYYVTLVSPFDGEFEAINLLVVNFIVSLVPCKSHQELLHELKVLSFIASEYRSTS